MAESETSICNMALSGIGAKTIVSYDDATDNSPGAKQSRLHYEQTRDSLQESHWWRFNGARKILSEFDDIPVANDFHWEHWFTLPADFLAMRYPYEEDTPGRPHNYSYNLEGDYFQTNESAAKIVYSKKVTDPAKFSPLFIELLVLSLQVKFAMGLGSDLKVKEAVKDDLAKMMVKVRAFNRQQTNTVGSADRGPWVNARY